MDVFFFEDDVLLEDDFPFTEEEVPCAGFFSFEEAFGAVFDADVSLVDGFTAALAGALLTDFFAGEDGVFLGEGFLAFKSAFICPSSFSTVSMGAIFSA